ncbi:MAG TPA: carboxypeptidase-like regulatory domain-containing protein [Candidatus Baltobacteraceae bacterium]|jgi:hypothetical protein|nr:carboxypeptidase-like regulatory domain-containing protein [Candidatus Baltobacteraceae bacterium]
MLLSLFFATLVTPAFRLDDTGSANFAMVRGIVANGDRRLVDVRVFAYSDTDARETRTNAKGEYYFMTLLPGVYTISAVDREPNGDRWAIAARCADDWTPMELSAGQLYEANIDVDPYCL